MKNLALLLFLLIAGCSAQNDTTIYDHPQRAEIENALLNMLEQNVDPFLIVEEQSSERFIQFYNEGGQILIDLPEDVLTKEETLRAQDYFKAHNIPVTESADTDPDTGEIFVSRTWSTTYGRDQLNTVVNVALGALIEIYQIPQSVQLTLTRGWE
jgi:hypothetical protein